jgi:hypothetical protein
LETQIEQAIRQRAQAIDEALLMSLVGSTITGFEVVKVKSRKHVYLVNIQTTAKPVALGNNAFAYPNEIKLRVLL